MLYMGTTETIGVAKFGKAGKLLYLSAFFFVMEQGSSWLDTCAVSTNMKNFPRNRALATGLLKSFFGLSGSIIAQVATGHHSVSTLWKLHLWLSCVFPSPCIRFWLSLPPIPPAHATQEKTAQELSSSSSSPFSVAFYCWPLYAYMLSPASLCLQASTSFLPPGEDFKHGQPLHLFLALAFATLALIALPSVCFGRCVIIEIQREQPAATTTPLLLPAPAHFSLHCGVLNNKCFFLSLPHVLLARFVQKTCQRAD